MTNALVSTTSSSSSSSTASSSVLRITGMASGIDTDAVVKSMVSSYQTKIDKANQAQQTLEWKQDAYRDIIKGVKGLQEYFDPLSSKYILSGNSMNINSTTNSDSSKFSATASSSAKTGTYSVTTTQLAEQAKVQGTSLSSMVEMPTSITASNWQSKTLMFNDGTNDVPITLSSTITDTNKDGKISTDELVADINKQITGSTLSGKVSASYVNDGTNDYIKFTKSASATNTITLSDDTAKTTVSDVTTNLTKDLTINSGISSSTKLSDFSASNLSFKLSYDSATTTTPITISATSTDTLQTIADKVNSQTSGAVTMNIDDTTGKISFQTKNYGSASTLTIADNGNLSALCITAGSSSGQDAIVSITAPGQSAVITTQSSNKFTSNGVTYSLVNKGTASTTVASNADAVVSNMKSFITDYNTIIDTINTKLTEKKDSAYPPLTDTQKASMSDTQISAWEAKAKVGILRNDDNLSSMMTQLRGIFSSSVYSDSSSNTKIPLSFGQYGTGSIGIDTSTDYTDGGKLVIQDESKLKDAIENNFDDFKKLFIGTSNDTLSTNQSYVGSSKYKEDGLFTRMSTILKDYVATPGLGEDGTYTLSGSMNIFVNKQYDYSSTGYSGKNTIPDQIYKQTLSITNLKTQMSDAEDRYYAKFSALESAMTTLSNQQSTLASMLGTS